MLQIEKDFLKAVNQNDIKSVENFIVLGVDIYIKYNHAFQIALKNYKINKDIALIKLLIENDKLLKFPREIPIYLNNKEVVELMIEKKYDFNTNTPIKYAAYHGHLEVMKLIVDKASLIKYSHDSQFDSSPLIWAFMGKKKNTLEYLLDNFYEKERGNNILKNFNLNSEEHLNTEIIAFLMDKYELKASDVVNNFNIEDSMKNWAISYESAKKLNNKLNLELNLTNKINNKFKI